MQLSYQQRRQLQKLRDYRRSPPTIPGLLRDGWRAYLYVTTVGLIGIVFFLWGGWPFASGFFAGMVLATIARDVGWYRRMVQSWLLQAEVTDWRRVEELLERKDGSAA
jgi:hypothetical protein